MPSVLLESYTGSNHSQGIAVGRLYRDIVGLSKRTKAKYSLLKQRLEGLISDLEQWHSIFDPSGYLLTRLVSGKVDDCTQADGGGKFPWRKQSQPSRKLEQLFIPLHPHHLDPDQSYHQSCLQITYQITVNWQVAPPCASQPLHKLRKQYYWTTQHIRML
ncbi:hypothetical protein RJZ56_001730 [Blastomyces dermatitidis]